MEIIKTERLVLRTLEESDWDGLCKILQDEEVMYAYEGAFDAQEVRNWLEKQWTGYREDGFGLWCVTEKDTGTMVGQCGITYQEWDGKRVPEIGYLFQKAYWHRGYATEAAITCREYAFHTLGFTEVYSIIRDTNTASRKVAERNGMKEVGRLVKHYRGVEMPHVVYCVKCNRS